MKIRGYKYIAIEMCSLIVKWVEKDSPLVFYMALSQKKN